MLCSRDAAKLNGVSDDGDVGILNEYLTLSEEMRRKSGVGPSESLIETSLSSKKIAECYLEAVKHA